MYIFFLEPPDSMCTMDQPAGQVAAHWPRPLPTPWYVSVVIIISFLLTLSYDDILFYRYLTANRSNSVMQYLRTPLGDIFLDSILIKQLVVTWL